jgi:hypothetical protein
MYITRRRLCDVHGEYVMTPYIKEAVKDI